MIKLFEAQLTAVNQATPAFMITGDHCVLDFDFDVSVLATIEWFLEFTPDNPNVIPQAQTTWHREVSEENAGGGVVSMPNVVRTFPAVAVGNRAANTAQARDAQFVRTHQFARIQIRASAGTVERARIRVPFGVSVSTP